MDRTDILCTELLHILTDIHTVLNSCLPLVEDLYTVALDLFQELEVTLGIKRGVDTDHLTTFLGHLTYLAQTLHNLLTHGGSSSPVFATSTQRQEAYLHTTHLIHGVEAVGQQFLVGFLCAEVLSVETTHRH